MGCSSSLSALLRSQTGQPFPFSRLGSETRGQKPPNHVSCAHTPTYLGTIPRCLLLSLSSAARGWRLAENGARAWNGNPGLGWYLPPPPPLTPRPEISVLHSNASARLMGERSRRIGEGGKENGTFRTVYNKRQAILGLVESCFSQGSGLDLSASPDFMEYYRCFVIM